MLGQVAGVVIDGACRDVDEARELGFPVFARGGAARTARARVYEVSFGELVNLNGMRINPCGVPELSPQSLTCSFRDRQVILIPLFLLVDQPG
jgi:hypothetical protein